MDISIIKDFEKYFDSNRLERGKAYFEEGNIKGVIIQDKIVKAIVIGNNYYRVKLDLSKNKFRCSCPDSVNCKHMVALFYYLRSNKLGDINKILKDLKKKEKKELIEIIKALLIYDQNLTILITKNNLDINKLIKKLWIKYRDELPSFYDRFDYIVENISFQKNKLDSLVNLIYRLIDLCDHGWNDEGKIDFCFEEVFELLNEEFKKIDKNKKMKIKKDIKYRLQNYDYLLDFLE